MKVSVSFYALDTGRFTGERYIGDDRALSCNTPAGCGFKHGLHDHLSCTVDLATGDVIECDLPPPPANTEWETFTLDESSGMYVGTPTMAAHWRDVRAERDRRLAESDWIVARAYERGEQVPGEWQTYRQALRDITTQTEPLAIVWPDPPA